MTRQRVEMLDARSEGHKGNQVHVVSLRVRRRYEVRGSRSSARADGGTVVRVMGLMSCYLWSFRPRPLSSWVLARVYGRWGTVVLFE